MRIYQSAFKDLGEVQLKKAIQTFCYAHEDIYPGTNIIAKIRKFALGIHKQQTATEALATAKKAQSKYFQVERKNYENKRNGKPDADKTILFKNEYINKTLQAIGIKEFYNSENQAAARAHFVKYYNELIEKDNFLSLAGEE